MQSEACDEMWLPLEALAQRVVERIDVPLVLPCQFMFMYHEDAPGLGRVHVYRHKHSRLYLNMTAKGRFVRYIPPVDIDDPDDDGRYVLTRVRLRTAIRALEIDEWTDWTIGDGYCNGCVELMERRLSAELGQAV